LERRLIPFVRRTELKRQSVDLRLPGVLLLDTLGELAGVFSQADVVFVGGSIAPRGGHNILEPAAFAVPIIIGLHMHNFESITRDFLGENALLQITSANELAPAVMDLLRHPETARAMGRRAQMLVEHKRGAAERVAQQLWPLYWAATPRNPYGILARIILAPLAGLWVWLGAIKARRDQAHQQRLPVPVIGVGGITTGGAGKTPFTNHLATELTSRGYRPAILTRGYRRRTPARNVILPPGARVSPALTGDEAQIFLRSTGCPVGIGADRAATGRLLMQHLSVDLFLLDDGFQHRKIYRDVDIVVIDGLQPFGLHHPVPLGRLREPLSALKRADVFVVTRADNNLRFEFLSRKLHTYNRTAPVFRVFTRPRGWRLHQQRVITAGLPTTRVAAFCALGNPQSFWNTLAQLGLDVVFRWSFPDHHVYQPAELRRISMQAQEQGASVLVTTEKDWINFPKDFAQNVAPLEVAWLEIENVIEGEAEFFTWLGDRLSKRFASSA
jgi:tetraacyldisaccharide 4'-kinase